MLAPIIALLAGALVLLSPLLLNTLVAIHLVVISLGGPLVVEGVHLH
ncbi:MAG: DUF3096 domain-containing protein [Dokdonella sp.]